MTVTIQRSPVAGQGLFASQDVPAGGSVLSIPKPQFSAVDNSKLSNVCSNCFLWNSADLRGSTSDMSTIPRMKICTGCRTLRFCSKQCQTYMWPLHKKECKLLGQLGSRGTPPNAVRLVLQVISDTTSGKDPLSELESHISDIVAAVSSPSEAFKTERYETLQVFSRGLFEYTGKKIDIQIIEKWFALVYTNALTVVSPSFDPLGICIDSRAAKANHSCDPNAVLVFDGLRMTFRALKSISKDDEIFISYIDNTRQYAVRQKELLDLYYFACKCQKCRHGATLKEDHCLKTVTSGQDNSQSEKIPVPTAEIGQDTALMIQKRTQEAYDALEEAKQASDLTSALDLLRKGIQHCLKYKIWPSYRQPLHSLYHETFVALLSLERWDQALKLGFKMYFETYPALYPEPFHPLRVVQKWTLTKLALLIADPRSPSASESLASYPSIDIGIVVLGLLTETLENVKCSHGEDHSFSILVKQKYEEVIVDMTRGDQGRLKSFQTRVQEQWGFLREAASSQTIDKLIS